MHICEPLIFYSQKSQRSFVDKQNVATSGGATIHEMELGRNIPRNEYFSANVETAKYHERQDTNTTFLWDGQRDLFTKSNTLQGSNRPINHHHYNNGQYPITQNFNNQEGNSYH